MCQAPGPQGKAEAPHCFPRTKKGWFPLTTTTWDPNPSMFPQVTLVTLLKQTAGSKRVIYYPAYVTFREGFCTNLHVHITGQKEKKKQNCFPPRLWAEKNQAKLGNIFYTLPHTIKSTSGCIRVLVSLYASGAQTLLPGAQHTPSHPSGPLTGSYSQVSKWADGKFPLWPTGSKSDQYPWGCRLDPWPRSMGQQSSVAMSYGVGRRHGCGVGQQLQL